MASVIDDGNGRRRVQFVGVDGERRAIRLGKVRAKDAESFKLRIEAILGDQHLGRASHDAELCDWLATLPDAMHEKLERVGLARPRSEARAATLGELAERFRALVTVKAGTMTTYAQAIDGLVGHFGKDRALESITHADADEWRTSLAESGLAPATVSKRVKVCKHVLAKGVRWGMVKANPLADLRVGTMVNAERSHYVPRATVDAILAACPDDQWRAIVGLSRFAGLRCPSEITLLRWGDVNWERGRMSVRSPKTAGHEGHATRVVPIAPELRPILERLFDQAEPGTEAVVPKLRDPSINLRTMFGKIIARAGEKPWPRLFHNMRASCATDWVERFPNHVAAGWLGHSPMIAATHYLQTRDAHFDLAAGVVAGGDEADEQGGAKCGARVAQNAAQHASALTRHEPSVVSENAGKPAGKQRNHRFSAGKAGARENGLVTPRGFEPLLPG